MAAHGPIQKLELVRDTVTLESKGFAFVNFVTPADGSRCLRLLEESGGLWLDGKKVDISFAHDRTAMAPKPKAKAQGMSSVAAQALAAASWSLAATSAPTPARATQQQPQQPQQQQQQQAAPGEPGSTYVLDASSGLYYDQASGYFYDPRTQVYLYYNQDQRVYMYYDEAVSGYVKYDADKILANRGVSAASSGKKGAGVGKAKAVEQNMDKWFKLQKKQAAEAKRAAVHAANAQAAADALAGVTAVGSTTSVAALDTGAGGWGSAPSAGVTADNTAPPETTDPGAAASMSASAAAETLAAERAAVRANAEVAASLESEVAAFTSSVVGGDGGFFGGVEAQPDLLVLGTNYDTCQQLRVNGRPIVLSARGKWAVLVSRRQFSTEEAVRSHVQLSELYREALQKLITAGQVSLLDRDDDL